MKRFARFLLSFLSCSALALYFGGFTFYAAIVVPDLHEHIGGSETGEISRRVAIFLYAIGCVALVLGWLVMLVEIQKGFDWPARLRFGLLFLNSILLAILMLMHRSLGIQVDSGENFSTFPAFHERYLTVWTGQWLGIVALLALDVSSRAKDNSAELSRRLPIKSSHNFDE